MFRFKEHRCFVGGNKFFEGNFCLHFQGTKFTLEQTMKALKGSRINSTLSLILVLMGVGVQRHTPDALPPQERPGTHCIGGWVGPRTGLDGGGKSRPPPGFEPRIVQDVTSRYTD